MQSPAARHLKHVLDIIAYLRKHTDMKITYTGSYDTQNSNKLFGYTDASHADNEDRRSTGGYVIFCNGGPVSWSTFVQDEPSGGGPAESEYKSAYVCARELRYLTQVLHEIGINQNNSIPIMLCDNSSAITFSHDNSTSSLLKSTDIKYRAIHTWLAKHKLVMQYVDTKHQ
jgi:hypothetical protein